MADVVTIKSYQEGIRLLLDADAQMDDIIGMLQKKFGEGRSFWGEQSLVLSLEGKELTEEEELWIVNTIEENCDLHIICLIGQGEEHSRAFLKAIQQKERFEQQKDSVRLYRGSLTDKQNLSVEESILILGDVNPDCVIRSTGSILVMGGLYGKAYAGGDGRGDSFLSALEFSPQEISLGDEVYLPASSKWPIKPKLSPKIAYLKDGKIVIEALSRASLENLYVF